MSRNSLYTICNHRCLTIAPCGCSVWPDIRGELIMSKPMPAADIAELRRMDLAHHLPAQSDYKLQHQLGGSRIIVRAANSTIEDAEGNLLLDGMAGLWCVNVGYGR